MRIKILLRSILLLAVLAAGLLSSSSNGIGYSQTARSYYLPLVFAAGQGPVLQWQYGGCYSSWCETGWYSSPAVVDLNGDGVNEVIASAYSLWALDGASGKLLWRSRSTSNRTWPGVVIADLDRDKVNEIITAQSGGWVSAYDLDGVLKWQERPANADGNGEFRGLLAADLDGSGGPLELVVTRAFGSARNTWVLDASGGTRPGWPRLSKDEGNADGYAWGVYNANAAAANISGDGRLELIVPSDEHYINAFEPDGSSLRANPIVYPTKTWGMVGVWESLSKERNTSGGCGASSRAEKYRANFADGPAAIADLNGDGKREVVVTGNMYDCYPENNPSRYTALFVFNADRTRFNSGGYDWRTIPTDTGAPISEDYNVIESAEANPAIADLDGDGKQEILYAAYDGRVHAFWLDKTEHGSWPYSVNQPAEGVLRFASEPVVADLNNDGKAEVIFASWTQNGKNRVGKLHILDWTGRTMFEVDLPAPRSGSWNGSLAAPTLANIDRDANLEVILNTAHSGVVVYELPNTSKARILWATGRGNFQRTGAK